MSKLTTGFYLICRFPVFNPEKTPLFEHFNKDNSILLYSALLMNYKEVLENSNSISKFYLCLDEEDKEFIPEELRNSSIIWYSSKEKDKLFWFLEEKYFPDNNYNLLAVSDSIGISEKDFKKMLNLLSIEDHAVIIGKSVFDKTCCIAFNSFENEIFDEFNWDDLNFDKSLNAACRQNANLHVLNSFQVIENLEEFRLLYKELSKKESLLYCSQGMHEKFTHLFIEYKDLLK